MYSISRIFFIFLTVYPHLQTKNEAYGEPISDIYTFAQKKPDLTTDKLSHTTRKSKSFFLRYLEIISGT